MTCIAAAAEVVAGHSKLSLARDDLASPSEAFTSLERRRGASPGEIEAGEAQDKQSTCKVDGWWGRYLPSCWYSSMVFFSPTLKPSVCSGVSSSSWPSTMVAELGVLWDCVGGRIEGMDAGKEG